MDHGYRAVPPTPPAEASLIDDLVWRRAEDAPDAPAVIDGDRTLGYAELAARAEAVASRLRHAGVGAGVPVALLLDRSVRFVIGAVAILRAGGACLLLSPTDPPERIAGLLDDVDPVLVVTETRHQGLLAPGVPRLAIDEVPEVDGPPPPTAGDRRRGSALDLAFVMATSGSTGRAKAVRITHANYTGQIAWVSQNLGLHSDDRVLLKAPVSFVSMLRQLVWPLAVGACLVVTPPGAESDVAALCRLIDRHEVTFMTFISPALGSFLRHARLTGGTVRNVVSGGDRFPPGMARRFFDVFPDARLHHTYGMTEAILISCALLRNGPDIDERTMGPVLPGAIAHVLDDRHRPVPVGGVGELFVGGVGLTPGYVKRPHLDRERFLRIPDGTGPRLFATCDRARLRADGTVELVGRTDAMVKIRGFRVDLGEIEHGLAAVPAVTTAVCRADGTDSGDSRITAFLVGADAAHRPSDAELRRTLAARLPDYMIPFRYEWLESVPLTSNGKVDRALLPSAPDHRDAPRTDDGPTGSVAALVRAAWANALADGAPAREDDFVAAGGTSLSAVELAAGLSVDLGIEIPVTTVVYHPSLPQLIKAVTAIVHGDPPADDRSD